MKDIEFRNSLKSMSKYHIINKYQIHGIHQNFEKNSDMYHENKLEEMPKDVKKFLKLNFFVFSSKNE